MWTSTQSQLSGVFVTFSLLCASILGYNSQNSCGRLPPPNWELAFHWLVILPKLSGAEWCSYGVGLDYIFLVCYLYPLDFPKKRLAARNTFQLGGSHPSSDSAQANRRPPPLPPGASLMNKKSLIVKGPPLPAVPRPRPVSSVDQTHSLVVKAQLSKSVSVGDIIPRSSTAEGTVMQYLLYPASKHMCTIITISLLKKIFGWSVWLYM